ncbi:transmembrane ascorbate-dependent reductase CYB561-like [Saccostrea cucullata]|uniref:transmembrane ascorbate-dependent reductase CYB561-like n=1 Tax=Saccostrea cuccullata TaxID=36930 RepID=UPI002ED4E5DF
MENSERQNQSGSLAFFTVLILVVQVLGLTAVILVAVWMGSFRGGFAWQSDPKHEFNYHPVFMVTGMIFLYSDAILTYRVFRNVKKTYLKAVHGIVQALVLIFTGVGLKAVFDSHNLPKPPIPNLYSLHSWLGIITVVLFGLQWVCGLISFVFPLLSVGGRQTYMPHHVFWGLAILCLAGASAVTGITEKALFTDFYAHFKYSAFPTETYIINFLGLTIVSLIGLVVYVVTRPEYKRQPSPEEEHIQLVQ